MQVVTHARYDAVNDAYIHEPYHSPKLVVQLVGLDRCVRSNPTMHLVSDPVGVVTADEEVTFKFVVINNDSPGCMISIFPIFPHLYFYIHEYFFHLVFPIFKFYLFFDFYPQGPVWVAMKPLKY